MYAQTNNGELTRRDIPREHPFSIQCGIPGLACILAGKLEEYGLRYDTSACIHLLVDLPCGFALHHGPSLPCSTITIVLTENTCPEYWEDLWRLPIVGLIVGIRLDGRVTCAIERAACGHTVCLTPPTPAELTTAERAVLRCVAQGWENQRIAEALHIEEKSVRNALTRVYSKLKVHNRLQAARRYWGLETVVPRGRE